MAIQETHWREDSATEFSTGEWQVVSSHRNGYKAAGVLILIHRTLLKKAVLAHAEPYPGRLLHLRVTHQSWALDCVVAYQRPLNWQRQATGVPVDNESAGPHGLPSTSPGLGLAECLAAIAPCSAHLALTGGFQHASCTAKGIPTPCTKEFETSPPKPSVLLCSSGAPMASYFLRLSRLPCSSNTTRQCMLIPWTIHLVRPRCHLCSCPRLTSRLP